MNELPEVIKVKTCDEDPNIDPEADIIVYADDNTPFTADEDPEVLQVKLQQEADTVSKWFQKNYMIVSSDSTKLLIVTTAANRAAKITPTGISCSVTVCGDVKQETKCEKILGITVNNQLNWKNHLYGDDENLGLVKELSKRLGMLKKVRKFVSEGTFKMILNGLFTSKLIYGITVYGGVWGLPGIYNEEPINAISITKEDMRKLQVLQNSALRILLNRPRETPSTSLLKDAKQLSVHQLVAFHTASQTYKIHKNQEPAYHYERLFNAPVNQETRSVTNIQTRVDFDLSLARKSFFYQAAHIWNALPAHMKTARSNDNFKRSLKAWVMMHISVKP